MSEKILQTTTLVFSVIEILVLWGIVIWAGIGHDKQMKKLCGDKEKEEFFFGKMGDNNRLKHKRNAVEKDYMKVLLISMDYMHFRKTEKVINKFTYPRDDKCIQWAKGFAIKATKSVVGDRVDEERFNEYVKLKKENKRKKKA